MKFLCDNCKAKYQIADEKVAGRTVRMKCRKCSHLIEIRASVTETSVALSAPAGAAGAVGEATMQVSTDDALATAAPRPGAAPGARAPSPAGKTAPRPGASAGGLRGASSAGISAPKAPARADAGASSPAGGLAGAFSDSVKSEPGPAFEESPTQALDMASAGLTEEWYVGINGVPVGPVRLAEFRAKIQSGAVTGESLVWREGFEEWLPLRNFPELNEILKSSMQQAERGPGARTASAARPLSAIASSALRSKSSATMSAVTASSSVAPSPTSTSRSNVVAFGKGATATAEKLDLQPEVAPEPAPEPVAPVADPFAAPAPIADPFASPVGAVPVVAVPVAANFAPVPEPIVAPATPADAPPQRRGGIPVAGWIAIAAALGLGVAAGSVLSSKPPPPPTVQIVTVSAVAPAAPVPTETATGASPETSAAPSASVAAAAPTAKVTGGGKLAAAAPEKTAEAAPTTPTIGTVGGIPAVGGVGAVGAVGGPSTGPGPTTAGGGGGAEKLTGEQVSSVVNAGKNAIRRACWEPALSARAPNGPSSARVVVNMTIGPDGRVKSASASGGDGFPTLASCIASRVRSWVFPTSQTTTQTAPSFSFVAQ